MSLFGGLFESTSTSRTDYSTASNAEEISDVSGAVNQFIFQGDIGGGKKSGDVTLELSDFGAIEAGNLTAQYGIQGAFDAANEIINFSNSVVENTQAAAASSVNSALNLAATRSQSDGANALEGFMKLATIAVVAVAGVFAVRAYV